MRQGLWGGEEGVGCRNRRDLKDTGLGDWWHGPDYVEVWGLR